MAKTNDEIREIAKKLWSSDDIAIDYNATIARGGEEEGVFVAAWVRVPASYLEEE